jgi:uncharacterized membrane protein YfcA
MFDVFIIAAIAGTFLLAGTVKGVIGLGLPTISLALLTVAVGLPNAMALLLVPSFVTNLWQAAVGGNGAIILRRLWPFLLMATATVWFGATALTRVDLSLLSALLGLLGPLLGTANGILTGMTGSFVVPGVLFLQAIGLSRDMLIQAMGMLFTVSTLALAVALQRNSLLTVELGGLSAMALLPAISGMVAGQRLRQNLSEPLFRRVFFVALLLLGAYIIASALGGIG